MSDAAVTFVVPPRDTVFVVPPASRVIADVVPTNRTFTVPPRT